MANSGNQNENKASDFIPVVYKFRVQPKTRGKTYALQQPFATLWDNLITVLWSVYSKERKIQIGITQLQWALEFMKCMKVDHGYPESIEKIVGELEDHLIGLYAKVGQKLQDIKEKKAQKEKQQKETDENEQDYVVTDDCNSYNEMDIMKKIENLKLPIDSETGEVKYLSALNSLGKKKTRNDDCTSDRKDLKNSLNNEYVIDKLKKALSKTTDDAKNAAVEDLIKQLGKNKK
ncbi:uncharacterized protein LOC126897201 [Daktulosphaira vitifoliae]|uniref:uncharacterized protein LOC126897201 n=1 Tax=Daktulosphaira vitifoliae TaxID=58002 RepID=UPI0021A99697|nr:uncharacterized protein LOC126897201 [Daktulosphaira vitifoliae]